MAELVQLTDLQVIQRFSLAVRGATADRAAVLAALRADVAWLQGTPGSREPVRPAVDLGDLPLADADRAARPEAAKVGVRKAAVAKPVKPAPAKRQPTGAKRPPAKVVAAKRKPAAAESRATRTRKA